MRQHASSQRGLSLTEMMIGLTIGLMVIVSALALLSNQLTSTRSLLADATLAQDLRAATSVMGTQLRRAGYWTEAVTHLKEPRTNPHVAIGLTEASPVGVEFRYDQSDGGSRRIGFRVQRGILQMRLGTDDSWSTWQSVTDPAAMTVLEFRITPLLQRIALPARCATPCPAETSECAPELQARTYDIRLRARSATHRSIERALQRRIHVRGDELAESCP